jgi:hypothetical protein
MVAARRLAGRSTRRAGVGTRSYARAAAKLTPLLALFLALAMAAAAAPKTDVELFTREAEAEQHCPADIIVWVDAATRIYHFRGQRWYGSTEKGGYACKKDAERSGYRQNRSGK